MYLSAALQASTERLKAHSFDAITIEDRNSLPSKGPENKSVWYRLYDVSCIYADLRDSSQLNLTERPLVAAGAYTYFIQSLSVIANQFGAGFVQIHGDAVFALFHGPDSAFKAFAAAVTWRTAIQRQVGPQFLADTKAKGWKMVAGVGMDVGTVIVRRLGAADREDKNEVWAGSVVNSAAKLSGRKDADGIFVTERAVNELYKATGLRSRCIDRTCGCSGSGEQHVVGSGLDVKDPNAETQPLWNQEPSLEAVAGDYVWRMGSIWCVTHGNDFCEVICTGKRP